MHLFPPVGTHKPPVPRPRQDWIAEQKAAETQRAKRQANAAARASAAAARGEAAPQDWMEDEAEVQVNIVVAVSFPSGCLGALGLWGAVECGATGLERGGGGSAGACAISGSVSLLG